MKRLFLVFIFLFSVSSFSQDHKTINGVLLDGTTEKNSPLVYAKITIKETGKELTTNEKGLFEIKDLPQGHYTLTCSFVGYETQEVKINTSLKNNFLKIPLHPKTISLEDLVGAIASVE